MDYDESHKLYRQARDLITHGELKGAISLLEKSNELYTHFKTLELWGECEINMCNYKEAIAPLKQAVELNQSIKPKSLLALAYQKNGDILKVIELAQSAVLLAPNNKIFKKILNETNIKKSNDINIGDV